jgi:hypothetical protein
MLMTLQSKSGTGEQQINSRLDQANAALPQSVKQDIGAARLNAQAKALALTKKKTTVHNWHFTLPATFTSVGVALAVVVLVSYKQTPLIPVLPAELLTLDVPLEDLTLLEDLEFADWLAEQQEVLL